MVTQLWKRTGVCSRSRDRDSASIAASMSGVSLQPPCISRSLTFKRPVWPQLHQFRHKLLPKSLLNTLPEVAAFSWKASSEMTEMVREHSLPCSPLLPIMPLCFWTVILFGTSPPGWPVSCHSTQGLIRYVLQGCGTYVGENNTPCSKSKGHVYCSSLYRIHGIWQVHLKGFGLKFGRAFFFSLKVKLGFCLMWTWGCGSKMKWVFLSLLLYPETFRRS